MDPMGWAHIHTLWFAEFCRSIGDGFALEAALKFKRIQEEQNTDPGTLQELVSMCYHISTATYQRLADSTSSYVANNLVEHRPTVWVFILPPSLRYDPDIHKTLFKGLLELELKTLKLHWFNSCRFLWGYLVTFIVIISNVVTYVIAVLV